MKALISLGKFFYHTYPELGKILRSMGLEVEELTDYDTQTPKEIIKQHIKNADIYIVGVEIVDKEVLDEAKKLKLLIKHGVGYNNFDVDYATKLKIPATFAKGANAVSVAELTMGLLLASARSIPQADRAVKSKNWRLYMGDELEGKTLGLIGLGAIGKAVAKRALAFDMKVIAFDVVKDLETVENLGIEYVEIEPLLKSSDFVSLHIPAVEENFGFMNTAKFKMMKSTACLINTSRGEVVNEEDLIAALSAKQIKSAAIDVYMSEPPREDILEFENLITTPHIGACSIGGSKNLNDVTVENIRRFINGEELLYCLNPSVYNRQVLPIN
jgi:phosphoglycerate dehydrogenase-like enzyme